MPRGPSSWSTQLGCTNKVMDTIGRSLTSPRNNGNNKRKTDLENSLAVSRVLNKKEHSVFG